MPNNRTPARWEMYKPCGNRIKNSPFIAFKVPLKEEICRNMPYNQRFTPNMLMEMLPNLAFIIDLTYTDRYYDPRIFESNGVIHCKIPCGGQQLPDASVVRRFDSEVDVFLDNNRNRPDLLIGVHCTHGLNRTGYFICRYLTSRFGWSPDEAINEFEAARGHKMERENYITALKGDRKNPRDHQNKPRKW